MTETNTTSEKKRIARIKKSPPSLSLRSYGGMAGSDSGFYGIGIN